MLHAELFAEVLRLSKSSFRFLLCSSFHFVSCDVGYFFVAQSHSVDVSGSSLTWFDVSGFEGGIVPIALTGANRRCGRRRGHGPRHCCHCVDGVCLSPFFGRPVGSGSGVDGWRWAGRGGQGWERKGEMRYLW